MFKKVENDDDDDYTGFCAEKKSWVGKMGEQGVETVTSGWQ